MKATTTSHAQSTVCQDGVVSFRDASRESAIGQTLTQLLQLSRAPHLVRPGLEDPIFSPLTGPPAAPGTGNIAGTDITVAFGNRIEQLNVRVDTGVDLEYGIRADNPAIRTVLSALFALATTDLNSTTEGGFREIAIRAADDMARGSQLMTALAAELGVKENTLDATETRHKDFLVVLETQLDRVENVDMAEAVSKLTQTQTNLEASFQLLANLRNLSLSNFL